LSALEEYPTLAVVFVIFQIDALTIKNAKGLPRACRKSQEMLGRVNKNREGKGGSHKFGEGTLKQLQNEWSVTNTGKQAMLAEGKGRRDKGGLKSKKKNQWAKGKDHYLETGE